MQAVTLGGILLISSIALLVLALFSLFRRRLTGAGSFSLLLFAMVIHTVFYAFELMSQTQAEMVFWLRLEYIGISFFPILVLFFARQYIDETKIANRWTLALVFFLNLITFLLVITSDSHHLYYQSIEVVESHGLKVLALPRAFWGNMQHVVLLISLVYATVGVYRRLWFSRGEYRARASYMMMGMMVPIMVYTVYAIGKGPVGIDLMPFCYGLMSILIGIGLFRFDLLFMTPVTYEMIIRSIDEGVIAIDNNGLVIRANDAARKQFPSLANLREGNRASQIQELEGFDFDLMECQFEVGERILKAKRIPSENRRGMIYLFNDVTEAERSKRELEIMATLDPLTGIQNRRIFMEKLESAPSGIFAILDLDHFKEINDRQGHLEGDRILMEFAQALRETYSFQQVCRYGGEEFAIFFPKTSLEDAFVSLEQFRKHCAEQRDGATFSAGMAEYESGVINPAILTADEKLYQAKAAGRNRIQI